MNLLLIEPDADQGRHWQMLVSQYAHQADLAFDEKIGLSMAIHRQYDGVIIHLPDPLNWVETLRLKAGMLPVLVLISPAVSVDTKRLVGLPWVAGYELPWQTDELVSRIQFLADRRRMSIGAAP